MRPEAGHPRKGGRGTGYAGPQATSPLPQEKGGGREAAQGGVGNKVSANATGPSS